MNPEKFSIKSRFRSFSYALQGLWALLKNEHNARIHLIAAFTAIVIGFILKINLTEWCFILIVIGLVFISELINTSLENVADVADPERNDKIKKAKDYSAAAVLISAILSIFVGILIFLPHFLQLFRRDS